MVAALREAPKDRLTVTVVAVVLVVLVALVVLVVVVVVVLVVVVVVMVVVVVFEVGVIGLLLASVTIMGVDVAVSVICFTGVAFGVAGGVISPTSLLRRTERRDRRSAMPARRLDNCNCVLAVCIT
jgi:hypothetical protein